MNVECIHGKRGDLMDLGLLMREEMSIISEAWILRYIESCG